MIIPYINLPFGGADIPIQPIRRIIVGPSSDPERRAKAIEFLLRQNKLEVEVVISGIPYAG
jgi:hypothetical protein